ncbi:hypothetical protein NL676_021795 [Syzygium grande]|nr:hypothetical protein NL676_021795 [Syzygium grande]
MSWPLCCAAAGACMAPGFRFGLDSRGAKNPRDFRASPAQVRPGGIPPPPRAASLSFALAPACSVCGTGRAPEQRRSAQIRLFRLKFRCVPPPLVRASVLFLGPPRCNSGSRQASIGFCDLVPCPPALRLGVLGSIGLRECADIAAAFATPGARHLAGLVWVGFVFGGVVAAPWLCEQV